MDESFAWPKVHRISIPPTRYHPMAPVWQNEGTNEGTVAIMDNYENIQCNQKVDDRRWEYLLILWHGDLKTILRIRTIQEIRMQTAERPYDKRQWVMPVLGLWHLKYNLLKLIHRTHWGNGSPVDQSTLQYAADAWNRSNVNVPSDFKKLEELLEHSYQARILALFLYDRQQCGNPFERSQDAADWIKTLSAEEFQQRLKNVVDIFNQRASYEGNSAIPLNQKWANHQRFIRHMDVYFLLRSSIKFADIELLRQALRETCIIFQSPEARADNYAPELIRLLQMVDSQACSQKLQRAILSNMLVNLHGDEGKTFEVDRLVEFLNRLVAMTKRDRLSSTKPIKELLEQITLTAPYLLQLKMRLEDTFGRLQKGHRPPKQAFEDIWTLAMDLCENDFHQRTQEQFSAHPATDLIYEGYRNLSQNISRHNERVASGLNFGVEAEQSDEGVEDGTQAPLHTTINEEMEGLLADIA